MAFANGNRRQLHPVCDIADGKNSGHIGPVIFVDNYGAVFIERNAKCLQTQILSLGNTSNGEQHQVGFDIGTIATFDHKRTVSLLAYGGTFEVEPDVDALFSADSY